MFAESKEVQGYFGPKRITREDFIQQWVEHYNQVLTLADTVAEFEELKAMQARIITLAGNQWDKLK